MGRLCGNVTRGIEMIIESVVKNEAIRNSYMIEEYESLIATLPKGVLICRKKEYYYLKYRENGKVCDKYIGKASDKVNKIREEIEMRKHYELMLSKLKAEQRAIAKIVESVF